MFKVGMPYNRSALHDKYGGNRQSGIANCKNSPYTFLFKSPSGKDFGYQDGWISNEYFLYTGEGQIGDMDLKRGNLAIRNHKKNGKQLHLFEKIKSGSGMYTYIGRFEYVSHESKWGEDGNQEKRLIFVFKLKKISE